MTVQNREVVPLQEYQPHRQHPELNLLAAMLDVMLIEATRKCCSRSVEHAQLWFLEDLEPDEQDGVHFTFQQVADLLRIDPEQFRRLIREHLRRYPRL